MGLFEAFKKECIKIGSQSTSKAALISEVVDVAKRCPALGSISSEALTNALQERERLGSTGFENGIAIPHCSHEDVNEFVVGIITVPEGIDFESLDGKTSFIFVFIIGPKERRNEHVRLLSGISRVLQKPETVKEILSCKNADVLYESFLRHVSDKVDDSKSPNRTLIHLFIQDEHIFNDILQAVSEIEDCSVCVLEASDSSKYLHGLPLFAGFWDSQKKGFHRLILATVRHSLANELLRRVSTIAGDLSSRKGVLLAMQELIYIEGKLDL
jgi:mannitol/fructose-specific phosphotransferase system IIA component (Ntr-type)